MIIFKNYSEFKLYLNTSDAQRRVKWQYERSLASLEEAVVLSGTCGLCLQPTHYTAPTRGGESAPGGRVPNWREGLACSCEHGLINRERALLHYLVSASLLRPWTRVLAMGEVAALRPALAGLSRHVTYRPGPLDAARASGNPPRGGYHLILSVEQLTAALERADLLGALAGLLAPGGTAVFTAPFAVEPPVKRAPAEGPVSWGVLDALTRGGFDAARVCTYWSAEMGYLGSFNLIVAADRM